MRALKPKQKPDSQNRFSARLGNRSVHSDVVPTVVHEVISSSGQPLDSTTRMQMHSRLGHDFGEVRVHVGARAEESARDVNARAYVVGRHVVFGAGQYRPGTSAGERLIAHEAAHVLQQMSASGRAAGLAPGNTSERAARAAEGARRGASALLRGSRGVGLARDRDTCSLEALSDAELEREFDLVHGRLSADECYDDREMDQEYLDTIVSEITRRQEGVSYDDETPAPASDPAPAPSGPEGRKVLKVERKGVRIDYEPDPKAYRGQELAYTADIPLEGVHSVGTYRSSFYLIVPYLRLGTDRVVFYSAYNPEMKRTEYVIGPEMIHAFIANETMWRFSAAAAYPIVGEMPDYKAESGKVVSRVMAGDLRGAFEAWVASWKAAVKDPGFWTETVMATAGAVASRAPAPRVGALPKAPVPARPPVAPAVKPPVPAAKPPVAVPKPAAPAAKPPAASTASRPPVRGASASSEGVTRHGPINQPKVEYIQRPGRSPGGRGSGRPRRQPSRSKPARRRRRSTSKEIERTRQQEIAERERQIRRTDVESAADDVRTQAHPRLSKSSTPSERLRADLERNGIRVPDGHDAHHIVPSKGGGKVADRARSVLKRDGVHLDTEPNGVPLPRTTMDPATVPEALTRHQTVHTQRYYKALAKRLEAAPPGTARDALRAIRAEIRAGKFPH